MNTNTTHNGWDNKQTWNINMVYEEIFATMAEEQKYDDVHHMADSFESLVNELEYEELKEGSFAKQGVGDYLDAVNWEEIAGHYFEEEISDEDKAKMQKIADLLELRQVMAELK